MPTVLGLKALSIAEGEIGNRPCPDKPSPTCRTCGPAMEKSGREGRHSGRP
jgi:hypothetical protein